MFFYFVTVEKRFFVSTALSSQRIYSISSSKFTCSDLVSYFIARILPNPIFDKPIFIYSKYGTSLWSHRNDARYGNLINYFYAATIHQASAAAVHYSMWDGGRYSSFITAFGSSRRANTTDKVLFVKKFENIEAGK